MLLFLRFDFRQAQSPKIISVTTAVGITTAMAIFQCAVWLAGLVLDVGVDATLDSVEEVGSDEERDESEGDDDEGDEADDA